MTRVAVVGVGMMGRNHARVYSEIPDVELAAVVDANPEMAEKASRMFHVPAFTDVQAMLESAHPDAVSVVVPTYLHFTVAKQVLENGCHVLVEKPIAASLDDAKALIAIAEEQDRIRVRRQYALSCLLADQVGHILSFAVVGIQLLSQLSCFVKVIGSQQLKCRQG